MRFPVAARALASLLAVAALTGCSRPRSGSPSVLLVTLDTTRADRIGAYGGAGGVTPHLDALAARGVLFERAWAVAPMTLPAHASMMTALLPPRTGVHWNGEHRLDPELATLAGRFRSAGYATGAFVSAAVLDAAFGLDRGFDLYDDEVGAGGPFEAERSGDATVGRAVAWLARQESDRPVFLWVHLFEPHDPYAPPADLAARFPGDPYAAEIAAADRALAPLFESPRFAARSGAVVAVLGDHGESLGEKGEATHGVLIHDAVLRIPWIVAAPGLPAGRSADPVSQVDLAPTLLALAGLPDLGAAEGAIDGVALFDRQGRATAPRARTLYAESRYGEHVYGWAPLRSTRRDVWKLVRGARAELFDTAADPSERVDRLAEAPAEAGALARALDETLARARPGTAAPVDAALAGQLRSLGYLSGGGGETPSSAADPRDRIAVHEKFRTLDAVLEAGTAGEIDRLLAEIVAADPGNPFARRAVEARLTTAWTALAERSPADPAPRLQLAALHLTAKRFAEAERWARAAVALAPGAAAARNALAVALDQQGRLDEAEREYAAILAADPGYLRAELNLALLRAARDGAGDRARAVAGLERVLARNPNEPLALWTLGRLAVDAGDRARAADLLARFVAAAPGHPRAAEARAWLATNSGSPVPTAAAGR